MKKITNKAYIMLAIAATMILQVDAGETKKRVRRRRTMSVETAVAQVDTEVSVLDQIIEQAKIMVETTGSVARKTRIETKKQIEALMKDLDPKVRDVIYDDIEIIKKTSAKTKMDSQKAFERLIATVNSINAQANVVMAMDQGLKAIEQAPENMKQQVIAQTVKNVQAADAQANQASYMSRVISGVKGVLSMPGDYIFNNERTTLRTALEVAAGLVFTAGAAYGAYQYMPEGISARAQALYKRGRQAIGYPIEEVQPAKPKLSFLQRMQARNIEAEKQMAERTERGRRLETELFGRPFYGAPTVTPVEPEQIGWGAWMQAKTGEIYNKVLGRPTAAEASAQARAAQEAAIWEEYHQVP